jgi:hypothetical protein
MRIRVTNVPTMLEPEAARVLHEELTLATRQIGAAVSSAVKVEMASSKPYPPIDTGVLRVGIAPVLVSPLKVSIAPAPVTNAYAIVQELGRRAGQPGPPLAPILAWVKRKLGLSGSEAKSAAYAIRRKLHFKGMPGRFFFKAVRARTPKIAGALVRAAVARWRRRVT